VNGPVFYACTPWVVQNGSKSKTLNFSRLKASKQPLRVHRTEQKAYQSIRLSKLNKTMGERSCSMHSMGCLKWVEKKNFEIFPLKSLKTATQSAENRTKGIPIDSSLKTE